VREELLQYLCCPQCSSNFTLIAARREGPHVEDGRLDCSDCGASYAISRGVPRFAHNVDPVEQETAAAFGFEWTRYRELADRYQRQFLDWIRPVEPAQFRDALVLEGGCGKGRHTAVAASFGARAVVAVDLSHAVDAAYANTRHLPNAHIIQADLKNAPVRRCFDYAFSVGVLHHLPEPEQGFRSLVAKVRPGGAVSAWVYGREGNGWIVHVVSPLRERFTSRLPHVVLDLISAGITVPLFVTTKLLYRPVRGRAWARRLPYGPYLSYISQFPFREQRSIVFDHLVAPVAHYISSDEFAGWFQRAGLEQVHIESHNANSWRGFARVPAAA
jgi:SAM-dependent methyltransferase